MRLAPSARFFFHQMQASIGSIRPPGQWIFCKAFFFANANLGWTVGQNGTILKTTNGGMPVELASFTATAVGSEVKLRWGTATETNNYGFSVERQYQAQRAAWETIGFVPGHGTSTDAKQYIFTDNPAIPGMYAYRLKQIDLDGKFEYSAQQFANTGAAGTMLGHSYPNPVSTNSTISFSIERDAHVSLSVYDALGRCVSTLVESEQSAGVHSAAFQRGKLASGSYTCRLVVDGRTFVKPFALK